MAVSQQHQHPEAQIPIASTENMNITSKRQRRPSVRLVEIGDQPAAALTKQWKTINKASKTRPLTNLGALGEEEGEEEAGQERERGDVNLDNLAIGSWKIKGSKPKRESKRPRTNWVLNKIDDEGGGGGGGENVDNVGEDGFVRDFEMERCESPLKEQNPVHDSLDNERDLQFRERIGEDNGVELDGPDDNGGQSARGWGREDDGVRVWLNGLGLDRYWPFFEIHEVDEEVLPLLTLEDLKDMGINAVGSRRKMFCAIQKLNKGFSS